jgi:hypothetical protein
LSARRWPYTVSSVRRRVSVFVLVALVGLLAPLVAHAHSSRVAAPAVDAGPTLDTVATGLRAAAPPAPSLAVLFGLAAGLLLVAAGHRPRRAFGLALVALLVVFAAETGVHSVHHLGDRAGTACAIAATAGHLAVSLDDGAAIVHVAPPVSTTLVDTGSSRPAAPSLTLDPARAPPAPIA